MRFIKINLFAYILLFVFFILLLNADGNEVKIKNEFLKLFVDKEESHFILESLIFKSPYLTYNEKIPSTSFAVIRINKKNYIYGSKKGTFIQKPKKLSRNKIFSEWMIDDIFIKQILILTNTPYDNKQDTLKVVYKIRNAMNNIASIGIRFTLDTYLGENDGVPFYMPNIGKITGYEFVDKEKLPPIWYAMESMEKLDFKVEIALPEDDRKKPDKVIFANWSEFQKKLWDIPEIKKDTFKKNFLSISDSAVSFYWYPKKFSIEQERTYSFYYGLFDVKQVNAGDLAASVSLPKRTKIASFFSTLFLQNKYSKKIKGITARIKSNQDDDFIFINQDVQLDGLDPDQVKRFSWEIKPKVYASGRYSFYVYFKYLIDDVSFEQTIINKIDIINRNWIKISIPYQFLSPNGDNLCDSVDIQMSEEALADKYLFIMNEKKKLVSLIPVKKNNSTYSWDGKNKKKGTIVNLPDGIYHCAASYLPDFTIPSKVEDIIIDTIPPELIFSIDKKRILFKDGEKIFLYASAEDLYGIKEWNLNIYNKEINFSYFTNSSGQIPYSITWDFKDNNGKPLFIKNFYTFKWIVYDQAGNRSCVSNKVYITDEEKITRFFPKINFDFDSSIIKRKYYHTLEEVIKFINDYSVRFVKIIGHTDYRGTKKYNKALSGKRANEVRDYILKKTKGLSGRITSIGKGEENPVADNMSIDGRALNRRVEVIVEVK